mgnify:FL=1
MKKLRKVDRQKRKQKRKDAQNQLAERVALMTKHPKECCVCQQVFERNHETVKTWMVTIISEKKTVRLTCPQCWAKIGEIIECQE